MPSVRFALAHVRGDVGVPAGTFLNVSEEECLALESAGIARRWTPDPPETMPPESPPTAPLAPAEAPPPAFPPPPPTLPPAAPTPRAKPAVPQKDETP